MMRHRTHFVSKLSLFFSLFFFSLSPFIYVYMRDPNRLEFRALLSSGLHPMSMMAGSLLLSMALCLLLTPLCREDPRVLFWNLLFTLYYQPLFRCNFWSWELLSQVSWWYGSLTKCTIWWTLFCPAKHLHIHWWYFVMDQAFGRALMICCHGWSHAEHWQNRSNGSWCFTLSQTGKKVLFGWHQR